MQPASTFCFDLASPLCYLAAERALHRFGGELEWLPVDGASLPDARADGAFRCEREEQAFREDVERRTAELGLQPLRWPAPFPFDSGIAMLAATYAHSIGRCAAFALAAFRQAFAGGHALDRLDFVLIAAAACEIHPRALRAAIASEATAQRLREATAAAREAGASELPAFLVAGETLLGERSLEQAAQRAAGR